MCAWLGRMLRVAKGMYEKIGHSDQCCFGRCEFGEAACTVSPKTEEVWGKGFHPFGAAAWRASVRTLLCEICTAFDGAAVSWRLGLCEIHSSLI